MQTNDTTLTARGSSPATTVPGSKLRGRVSLTLGAMGVLLAGIGAGCGASTHPICTSSSCQGASNGSGTALSTCVRDQECSANEYCAGGTCAPRSSQTSTSTHCTQTQDCSFGKFCNIALGQCVDCLNNDACELGQVCRRDGTCGTSTGCSSNADCGALVCNTSTQQCVQCLTSGDCPSGQTCRNNACFTNNGAGGSVTCSHNADCASYGQVCKSGVCAACTRDSDCDRGQTCQSGVCNQPPPTSSSTQCSTSADCGGQACVQNACTACLNDSMCNNGGATTTICDTTSGKCTAPQCSSAANCPAGQGCYAGHCGPCIFNTECRPGETCDASTGICSTSGSTTSGCTTNGDCSGGQVCLSGSCGACTSSTQCSSGQVCSSGACVTNPNNGGSTGTAFGGSCTSGTGCAAGLTCLLNGSSGVCTRNCIGSGKGGDADCPTGFACEDFNSGTLDGVKLCVPAASLPSTYPGQPFTTAPGGSCASGNTCQTSVCYTDSQTCARGCGANRDCNSGEVCYALWTQPDPSVNANAMTGDNFCYPSNAGSFKAAGAACNSGMECNSGLCVGFCSDNSPCNQNSDCSSGVCQGICEDHCRSNADCQSGETCNPWPTKVGTTNSGWVPTCMPHLYNGTKSLGASCSSSSECASDWCVGGMCTTMCMLNSDCSGISGSKCETTSFTDTNGNAIYAGAFCLMP